MFLGMRAVPHGIMPPSAILAPVISRPNPVWLKAVLLLQDSVPHGQQNPAIRIYFRVPSVRADRNREDSTAEPAGGVKFASSASAEIPGRERSRHGAIPRDFVG